MEQQDISSYYQNRIRSAEQLKRLIPFQPLSIDKLNDALENTQASGQRALYIHIPFCNKSCSFCGYFKCIDESETTKNQYVDRLIKQIGQLANTGWVKSGNFQAVYFGGGTPTNLKSASFSRLLNAIVKYFPLNADCEITLETTITDLNDEYIEALSNASVNRISLGIQSFNSELRRKHSRNAKNNEIKDKIHALRKAGITNICADLIYGLNEQTQDIWKEDLEQIASLNLDGCSVYPLVPFPNSPLVRSGQYKAADIDTEYAFFKLADDFLMKLDNWEHKTIVQYGETGKSAAYIELQAADADILALGPGSGGRINGMQYISLMNLEDFNLDNAKYFHPKVKAFRTSGNFQNIGEQLSLFRTGGGKHSHYQKHNKLIEKWMQMNLIELSGENIILTQPGRFYAANMAAELIEIMKNVD